MDKQLLETCELFDANNRILMKKYWLEWTNLTLLSGAMHAEQGRTADVARLKECKTILKKYFGVFSHVRGLVQLPVLTNMALSDDPDAYAQKVKAAYDAIKKGHVFSSEFDVLAAMILCNNREPEEYPALAQQIMGIYKAMQKNHPLLTSREDLASATMFALDGRDPEILLEEMETCYHALKPHFLLRGDEIQTMSALLSVYSYPTEEKCEKVRELVTKLKKAKMSLSFSMALPIVAALASLRRPADQIVDEVAEVFQWLKGKKGMGVFGAGREGRAMYAILLYLNANAKDCAVEETALQGTLSSIILMEIIMMIIVTSTASSHAATSSSSGSH